MASIAACRTRTALRTAGAVLFVALAGRRVVAQQPPTTPPTQTVPAYRLRLLGVYDQTSGEPIEGAEVADVLTGTNMLTSSTGTVSLLFMPDGGGLVRVRKVGYEAASLAVRISPADTIPITVILTRAVALPAMVTRDSVPHYRSPGLQGFEERRAQKFGYFVTEADLRKSDGRRVSDMLRPRVPGLVFIQGPGSATYVVAQSNCGTDPRGKGAACGKPRCYVQVYMDGTLYGSGPTDFNRLDVSQFAGIEYYSGGATVPPQFNATGADCGVLLLWTRER